MPGSPSAVNLSACGIAVVAPADSTGTEVFGIDKSFVILAECAARRTARQ